MALRLKDMALALDAVLREAHDNNHGHAQCLASLVSIQCAAMQKRSLDRRFTKANFPLHMTFDTFDFGFQPALNVPYLKDLMALDFINKRQPLLILGKPGTGKTHIAAALGVKACEAGFKVGFHPLQELLAMLYKTLADDSTDELIRSFSRLDLMIIDQVGYIRLKDEYASLLHDLVCACHQRLSLIVTTAISIEEWGNALGNPSITHAIVDRLFHQAHVINIHPGISYRSQGPNSPQRPTPA
jgi:DNA replication protein DnaC